jgi:hypothetical protein
MPFHEMGVFDALDAGDNRLPNRGGGIGVRGDVRSPVPRVFDGGTQLGLGERDRVERAVWRSHSAASADLDLRGAAHQLLARPHADFIRAVGDHALADLLGARKRSADRARQFDLRPEVAVAAGDGDHRAGGIDARTGDDAFIDGAFDAEAGPAHVAHGG